MDDFESIADYLYAVVPEEFIALRTSYEKQAKQAGDAALAVRVRGLAKPNVVAWLANQLVRQHRDELEPLIALGAAMREATQSLSGDQLRELTKQQRQLVHAMTKQAGQIAASSGKRISQDGVRDLEATLHAALADPAAAAELLAARLTQPLRRSGFDGAESEASDAARPNLRLISGEKSARPTKSSTSSSETKSSSEQPSKPSLRARAAERAAAAKAQAHQVLDDAALEADEAAEELEGATANLERRREQLADLAQKIDDLRHRLDAALADETQAQRNEKAAETRLARAERAATSTERRLREATAALNKLK